MKMQAGCALNQSVFGRALPAKHWAPALLFLALVSGAQAQYNGGGGRSSPPIPNPSGSDPLQDSHIPKPPAAVQEKMAIQRNDERQRRLVADTEKLLVLSTQLKSDVDKTDKYMLSLDVIKRADEIEKLAREIKERAKN